MAESEREIVRNATVLDYIKLSLEKMPDPGLRGYDAYDLHENIRLKLDPGSNGVMDIQNQTESTINGLGISFDYPNDWNFSEISSRTLEGEIEVKQLSAYPEEVDPTVVWFFDTEESLDRVRNIELVKSNTSKTLP